MSQTVKRIAFLASELSGYTLACWKALHERHNVEILAWHYQVSPRAPFALDNLSWLSQRYERGQQTPAEIARSLQEFAPQGIYIVGWMDKGYLQAARTMRAHGAMVVSGMDNQWHGSARQQAGRVLAKRKLHASIDAFWVAGERQAQFARRLGFDGPQLWRGLYCCDWDAFASPPDSRAAPEEPSFLFVGRYAPEKGLHELLEAYRLYRARVAKPWKLRCAGAGPLGEMLRGQTGVEECGFVQPRDLPALLQSASAFVLPSRFEPWGVALQEAGASGLPLIASDACGAGVHLLQDRYNGRAFATGNAAQLARCLEEIANASPQERLKMGRASFQLAQQFTPARWADTWISGLASLGNSRGHSS